MDNKKGFTLIELLIVVVIIGILAAIAIPRFGETRERAFVSAMQSDINQARQAMEMCYQDNSYTYVGCDVQDDFPGDQNSYTDGVTLTVDDQSQTHYTINTSHSGTANWTCDYAHADGAAAGQIVCEEGGAGGDGGG